VKAPTKNSSSYFLGSQPLSTVKTVGVSVQNFFFFRLLFFFFLSFFFFCGFSLRGVLAVLQSPAISSGDARPRQVLSHA
jgi:hypothetical protein